MGVLENCAVEKAKPEDRCATVSPSKSIYNPTKPYNRIDISVDLRLMISILHHPITKEYTIIPIGLGSLRKN